MASLGCHGSPVWHRAHCACSASARMVGRLPCSLGNLGQPRCWRFRLQVENQRKFGRLPALAMLSAKANPLQGIPGARMRSSGSAFSLSGFNQKQLSRGDVEERGRRGRELQFCGLQTVAYVCCDDSCTAVCVSACVHE